MRDNWKEWSEKDSNLKIENIKVYKILKSLVSKGLATEVYNWGYYYYTVNDKGVTHLKNYLGFTDERLKPATFMAKGEVKTSSAAREGGAGPRTFRGGRGGARGGRAGATEGGQEPVEGGAAEGEQPQAAGEQKNE